MTIICAMYVPGEGTWIGSDTIGINGNDEMCNVGPKWVLSNGWAAGFAGDHAMQIIAERHKDEIFGGMKNVNDFQARFGDVLRAEHCMPDRERAKVPFWGGWYLLVRGSSLWSVDSTLCGGKFPRFAAEGAGCQFARGAYFGLRSAGTKLSPRRIMATTIRAACEGLTSCGGKPWIRQL